MLKHGGQYGKWYKLKRENTVDCVVTNIIPGKGKFANMAGAVVCSLYDTDGALFEVASVSGMDDATRAAISRRDIGRVVEVKYQMVGSRGRLTHPRFVRWRDDKPKNECTISQIEEAQ